MNEMIVAAFYSFFAIPETELPTRKQELKNWAQNLSLQGMVVLAPEGLNCTLSGSRQSVAEFCRSVEEWIRNSRPEEGPIPLKVAPTDRHVFRRFSVKIRPEIVTTTSPDLSPLSFRPQRRTHLSPEEWDQNLKDKSEDFVLIDTRNWYETKIGTFRGALDPKISEFTEFSSYFEALNLPKDQKVLLFCTGGIRCEKGILELEDKGYNNVYQLEGGILNYLKEFPKGEFEGECFVFDHRVAVQPSLEASNTYGLCPHCGQPGKESITCSRCDHETKICETCQQQDPLRASTCSKNCAHHWSLRPGQKGPRQNLNL